MRYNRQMRGSKQEQFTVTNNPCESGQQQQRLLNDIYARVKAKSVARETSTSDSNIVLLSYLSASHAQEPKDTTTHENIQHLANSLQRVHTHHARPKRPSQHQRLKTDLDELDSATEVQFLRRENETLKQKLSRCEKRVIELESFQCEAEYMRKLLFIQSSEIEKLRRMLKAAREQQLYSDLPHPQTASLALKQRRNDHILINDHQNEHKGKKCNHRGQTEGVVQAQHSRQRSMHSKSKEEVSKKHSCKVKRDKNICR